MQPLLECALLAGVVLMPRATFAMLHRGDEAEVAFHFFLGRIGDKDPGWFEKPPGTLVTNATEEDMKRDLGFIPTMEHGTGSGGHQHHPG